MINECVIKSGMVNEWLLASIIVYHVINECVIKSGMVNE